MPRFADVILPLALARNYTYRIPDSCTSLQPGQRVVVQFGKRKLYTALVWHIHEDKPAAYDPKELLEVLDEQAIVNKEQLALWDWIARYYMCSMGAVMNAALPTALKLESETRITLNKDFRDEEHTLNDDEYLVVEAFEFQDVLRVKDVSQILDRIHVLPLVKGLVERGVLAIEERLVERYKPKVVRYVRLAIGKEDAAIQKAFETLEKAPKQKELFLSFFNLSAQRSKAITTRDLLKSVQSQASTLDALVKKGLLEVYKQEDESLGEREGGNHRSKQLSEHQQEAFESIKNSFQEKEVTLFHGVTSSGKTEVYVRLIEDYLAQGRQVLYLLPEIALTTQIIQRLQRYFGDRVAVYHSKFNNRERVQLWKALLKNDAQSPQVILGARSALFLPFTDLGLVIVDEEHESSFKQYEPAPRYHARDTAMYLARLYGAKTLLGSATPSIESYYNAREGKYGLVTLTQRYGAIALPEIEPVDIRYESKRKRMKSHFSPRLIELIEAALKQDEQVILFQNRRGFAPMQECKVCAWVPHCVNCDVSLTYHKAAHQLKCHYCGYAVPPPSHCQACGSNDLQIRGFGTEKIEEELALILPEARIKRMDLDTTRKKHAYQQIINDFEQGAIDILVGTQMVTKGLDFDRVALVGILNADQMLNFPDFRAFERAYQLMTQVAGRAGRKQKQGKVLIQTHNPEHVIIQQVRENQYEAMYGNQLTDREHYQYPPFFRLIRVMLKHRDYMVLNEGARVFGQALRKVFGARVLGPEFPLIQRLRGQYQQHVLIKLEKGFSPSQAKKALRQVNDHFSVQASFKSIQVLVDVDPM